MRAASKVLLSFALALPCAAQTVTTTAYESLPSVVRYSHGYLFGWDGPQYSRITMYGRDARQMFSVKENRSGIYYIAWAVDSDGVAAGAYRSRKVPGGRIDVFDPNGRVKVTINTGTYISQHVAFAPDHTIWTAGYKSASGGEDFNVFYHYARTGRKLGQMLSWSRIAGEENSYSALQAIVGGKRFYIGRDRIGFAAPIDFGHSTWIEVSCSRVLLGKYDLGNCGETCYVPAAMTASGSVYAAVYRNSRFDGWAVLNHSKNDWEKISGYPGGTLIGSDGENLVFSIRAKTGTPLRFVPPGSLPLAKARPRLQKSPAA